MGFTQHMKLWAEGITKRVLYSDIDKYGRRLLIICALTIFAYITEALIAGRL